MLAGVVKHAESMALALRQIPSRVDKESGAYRYLASTGFSVT